MLNNKSFFSNVVLIGSTSDIGISIINNIKLSDNSKIHLIGRKNPRNIRIQNPKPEIKFHKCDFTNHNEVSNLLTNLAVFGLPDLVIIAAGYLPEENSEFELESLNKIFHTNTISPIMFLAAFAKIMKENDGGKILVCSSVASIRPRLRNFSYGASKSALDFYSIGLQNKLSKSNVLILVLRSGFVFTKMTKNFQPALFSISLETLTNIAINGLLRNERVIYAPLKLKLIMNLVRFIPRTLFDKID